MKTAWLSLLALGIGATIATACTITTTDGSNMGGSSNDTGGSTARGGTGSGGATTGTGGATAMGGSTAATGGAATGTGGAATGGTGGAATAEPTVVCDGKTAYGTALDSCTFEMPDNTFCHECLSGACCDAVKQCYATGANNTGNACAYGGPDGESEFTCFEACIVKKAKAGSGDYTEMDVDDCSTTCSTAKCGGFPGSATSEIIGCMTHMCEKECILDPSKL